jgi:hypothetical protein
LDDQEELLLILWRAEEAIRPERQQFRVTRLGGRSGSALIRHPGFRGDGDQPFMHHARQDIEDLIERRWIRRKVRKMDGSERWELDLTEKGRDRAKGVHAAEAKLSGEDGASRMIQLVRERAASAGQSEQRQRWANLAEALAALEADELRAFMRSLPR